MPHDFVTVLSHIGLLDVEMAIKSPFAIITGHDDQSGFNAFVIAGADVTINDDETVTVTGSPMYVHDLKVAVSLVEQLEKLDTDSL